MSDPPLTCGFEAAMDLVGGKWKPLIRCALEQRTHRFGELRRAPDGVSEKVLAQQLRELEADGVVARIAHDEVPPRVECSLTEDGAGLLEAIAPLGAWARARTLQLDLAQGTSPAA